MSLILAIYIVEVPAGVPLPRLTILLARVPTSLGTRSTLEPHLINLAYTLPFHAAHHIQLANIKHAHEYPT